MDHRQPLLIAVMGPTASGKTPLAEFLSAELGAKLINADAFQIYRGLDIGTAKPMDKGRYELLDIKHPWDTYGVGEWVQSAAHLLSDLFAVGRNAIVVGGTGLYIRALFEQYSDMLNSPDASLRTEIEQTDMSEHVMFLKREHPDIASKLDLHNPVRVRRAVERVRSQGAKLEVSLPPFRKIKLALDPEPTMLQERLAHRVGEMLQNGWIREIEQLKASGCRPEMPAFRAIGYRPLWQALEGEKPLEEAVETTIVDTRRYAKRQRTWLRSEPNLTRLSVLPGQDVLSMALERLRSCLQ